MQHNVRHGVQQRAVHRAVLRRRSDGGVDAGNVDRRPNYKRRAWVQIKIPTVFLNFYSFLPTEESVYFTEMQRLPQQQKSNQPLSQENKFVTAYRCPRWPYSRIGIPGDVWCQSSPQPQKSFNVRKHLLLIDWTGIVIR